MKPRRRARRIGVNMLGVLVFVVMVFPVYWMVSTAFKEPYDILSFTPEFIPSPATVSNFENALNRPNFWSSVLNSLVVVVAVTAMSMVLAFLAALALAKFRFRGRAAFVVVIIGVQMVPLNALIIPLYILLSRAHQVDKLSGVVITYLTFVLPFCVWTLRGTEWGPLMAAATLTALPVVIFFVIIHRRIAFGLTAGAVRG